MELNETALVLLGALSSNLTEIISEVILLKQKKLPHFSHFTLPHQIHSTFYQCQTQVSALSTTVSIHKQNELQAHTQSSFSQLPYLGNELYWRWACWKLSLSSCRCRCIWTSTDTECLPLCEYVLELGYKIKTKMSWTKQKNTHKRVII